MAGGVAKRTPSPDGAAKARATGVQFRARAGWRPGVDGAAMGSLGARAQVVRLSCDTAPPQAKEASEASPRARRRTAQEAAGWHSPRSLSFVFCLVIVSVRPRAGTARAASASTRVLEAVFAALLGHPPGRGCRAQAVTGHPGMRAGHWGNHADPGQSRPAGGSPFWATLLHQTMGSHDGYGQGFGQKSRKARTEAPKAATGPEDGQGLGC